MDEMQTCRGCDQVQPIEHFQYQINNPAKLNSWCRSCRALLFRRSKFNNERRVFTERNRIRVEQQQPYPEKLPPGVVQGIRAAKAKGRTNAQIARGWNVSPDQVSNIVNNI